MKKIISLIAVLALTAVCLFAFASCGGHEHSFAEEWQSDELTHWHAATCGCEEKSAVAAHTPGTDGKCTVCNYQVAAPHAHTYAETWSFDNTNHWHAATCAHTDAKIDVANHTLDSDRKCTVCGYQETNHTHTFDYSRWEKDATGHWYASECGHDVKDAFAEHSMNGSSCVVCGYVDEHTHTFDSEWLSDDNNHWHAANCGHNVVDTATMAAHTYDSNFECTVCGFKHIHVYDYASGLNKDADGHWYGTLCGHNVKGHSEAHLFNSEYRCTVCSYQHVHTYSDTVSFNGIAHWYASTCGHAEAKKDYAEHTVVNGKCQGCDYTEEVTSIYDIINNTQPTKIVTIVEYVGANGDLLGGEFSTVISGNNLIMTYSYDRYSTFDEALEEGVGRIKTVEGTVYYRDGLYSEDGFNWSAQAPSNISVGFNFSEEYLINPKLDDSGFILNATLDKAGATAIFGTDLSAKETVNLTVETNGVNLFRIVCDTETESGGDVKIRTSYTFNPVNLEYPDGEGSVVEPEGDELDAFNNAFKNTEFTSATISTVMTVPGVPEALTGLYDVVYNEDGTVTVSYSYMKLNKVGEGNGYYSVVTGTATIAADGTVNGDVEGVVAGVALASLVLDAELMEYTIEAGVLTATVEAENTEAIFGNKIDADVTLTVTVVNGEVVAITVSMDEGNSEIVCTYR